MKKQLLILASLLIAIVVCLFMIGRQQINYCDFSSAENGVSVHITGKLDHARAISDENDHYSFWMIDKNGIERQVIVLGEMPQDFERSNDLVIIGYNNEHRFIANGILMKCRSTYSSLPSENDPVLTQ